MAKTANVFVRIEPELKEQAEQILDKLGLPISNAINMFLRQVVLQRGIPFDVKLPESEVLVYDNLTVDQFNAIMQKVEDDIKQGNVFSAEDVEKEMKEEFGV